jgi:NADP-dependent aldehyde dehydrogenase
LGSVNPVVVLPGAASAKSAEIAAGYAASLTTGTGQFCTNPGLMFVPTDSPLLAHVADAVSASHGGAMLTDRISTAYRSFSNWDQLELVAAGSASAAAFTAQPEVRGVELAEFAGNLTELTEERFGPAGLIVSYSVLDELVAVLDRLPGSLTASVHATATDTAAAIRVTNVLKHRAGRLIMNGWPTGVAVYWPMHHGGPWPASTDARHTSVGATAIDRWLTPVAFQDWPDELLPDELRRANPRQIPRRTEEAQPK